MENIILNEVKGFLDDNKSIMFAFDESLLIPEFSDEVPTAAVMFEVSGENNHIRIVFNEQFWGTLQLIEKEFVFSHEVFHIMFKHGRRGAEYFERIDESHRDRRILNVAMDICINEILFNQYFFTRSVDVFPVLAPMVCTIDSVFGDKKDLVKPHQNFEYYYEKIFELLSDEQQKSISTIGLDIDFDSGSEDAQNGGNGEGKGKTPEEQKAEDELIDAIIDAFKESPEERERGESAGFSLNSSGTNVVKEKPDTPEVGTLEECLKKVVGTSNKIVLEHAKTNWYRTNRRSAALTSNHNSRLIIPVRVVEKPTYLPSIAIYSDVSGSVANMSRKFFSLIAGLDDTKYEVTVFAWTTIVAPVVIDKKQGVYQSSVAGYGTNIESVLSHVKKASKKYDAIIVLTDGEYTNITGRADQDYSKWNFFFTGSRYSYNAPKESKKFILKG